MVRSANGRLDTVFRRRVASRSDVGLGLSKRKRQRSRGARSPYVPTKGEWLCLFLNSRHALMNSERVPGGVAVHYLYDLTKPDTIRIKVLFTAGTSEEQVRRYADRAEHHAIEAAKVHGWQNWLKIDHEERKVTDMFASEELMR